MNARLLAESGGASVFHSTWRDLLPIVEAAGGCDALIVDAPYSARTHTGHDEASATTADARRSIDYGAWGDSDVAAFCEAWIPQTRGWVVSITDHELAVSWSAHLERLGRYVFSPIACVQSGSRVRILGDGPSQWSTWAIVARPRDRHFSKWGALPGAYVVPAGHSSRSGVVGGKPSWLMRALVEDYTRPGDLVVDPCCGAGTTLVAARALGRRAIGGDAMLEHAEIAAERIRALPTAADKRGTLALFGSVG